MLLRLSADDHAIDECQAKVVQAITEILPTGGPPARVLIKDIKAGESLLHIISGVLIPTTKASI